MHFYNYRFRLAKNHQNYTFGKRFIRTGAAISLYKKKERLYDQFLCLYLNSNWIKWE